MPVTVEEYNYSTVLFTDGIPMLVSSPVSTHPVTDSTPYTGTFISDSSSLTGAPYMCNPDYPLMFKVFCTNVQPDRTGEFIFSISGSIGSTRAHRLDANDFALTWQLPKGWNTLGQLDATVSVTPLPPMVAASLTCLVGLAVDTIDRPDEN